VIGFGRLENPTGSKGSILLKNSFSGQADRVQADTTTDAALKLGGYIKDSTLQPTVL
jgi:hypothetical protein